MWKSDETGKFDFNQFSREFPVLNEQKIHSRTLSFHRAIRGIEMGLKVFWLTNCECRERVSLAAAVSSVRESLCIWIFRIETVWPQNQDVNFPVNTIRNRTQNVDFANWIVNSKHTRHETLLNETHGTAVLSVRLVMSKWFEKHSLIWNWTTLVIISLATNIPRK